MKYNTRHGFAGYERQVHPRAEKVVLVALLLIPTIIILVWWL